MIKIVINNGGDSRFWMLELNGKLIATFSLLESCLDYVKEKVCTD